MATIPEWSARIRSIAEDESRTLRDREEIVKTLCSEAAEELGLETFPAGNGFLRTLGMRRMATEEGHKLPSGATLLGSSPGAPGGPGR